MAMRGGAGGGRGLRSGESTAVVGAKAVGGVDGCTVSCGGVARGMDGGDCVDSVAAPCSTSSSEWLL